MEASSIFFYMMLCGLLLVPMALAMTDFTQPINTGLDGPGLAAAIQILNSVGALTLVFAFRYGKAIIVSPLVNAGAPLLTAVLSMILLGAMPGPTKIAGIVLALTAALLLALQPESARAGSERVKALQDIVARHTRGEPIGIWSLCSAHPAVIESAMHEAAKAGSALLVEATSNQVNQFGGYTGMRPADFVRFLRDIAARAGLPADALWIGGDHLGPNAWRGEPADAAMAKAADLVREYVAAGFRKIHLDCSMACGGDAEPLAEEIVARRAAASPRPPTRPGARRGASAGLRHRHRSADSRRRDGGPSTLAVTRPQAAAATIEAHREAFARAGLEGAWPRVVALVVQPGVEFDHDKVVGYRPQEAQSLSEFIARQSQFIFEAHSTDYQSPDALEALVRDHFAILKVGPGATYALREAIGVSPPSSRRWTATAACRTCARSSSRSCVRTRSTGAATTTQGRRARPRPAVQPERPHPLLLAVPRGSARVAAMRERLDRRRSRSRCSASSCRGSTMPCARTHRGHDGRDPAGRRCGRACGPTSLPAATGRGDGMSTNGFPGLPAAELESRGARWTAREIAQQPEVWMRVGDLVARERGRSMLSCSRSSKSTTAHRADRRRHVGVHRRLPGAALLRGSAARRGHCDHGLAERPRPAAAVGRPDAARLVRAFRQQPRERRRGRARRAAPRRARVSPRHHLQCGRRAGARSQGCECARC